MRKIRFVILSIAVLAVASWALAEERVESTVEQEITSLLEKRSSDLSLDKRAEEAREDFYARIAEESKSVYEDPQNRKWLIESIEAFIARDLDSSKDAEYYRRYKEIATKGLKAFEEYNLTQQDSKELMNEVRKVV